MAEKLDAYSGQAAYNKMVLRMYDFLVLKMANRFLWKCKTEYQLNFFNKNITNNHLEVGVGSAYYIDNCQFPDSNNVNLALLDMNNNCLEYGARKLKRYSPKLFQQNIYEKIIFPDKYDSISLNYVLHCLPGNMKNKETVFANLKELLNPNGVIFGSTILGQSNHKLNWLATKIIKLYNRKQIFSNLEDNKNDLYSALSEHFRQVEISQIGAVAFFKVSQGVKQS